MAALVLVPIGVTISWFDQPRRTTGQFVGEMHHERYGDAVVRLFAPSTVSVESDGGLVSVDQNDRSVSVSKMSWPFLAGGHDGDQEHDFKMTALGPGTDGILHDPAVTITRSSRGSDVMPCR